MTNGSGADWKNREGRGGFIENGNEYCSGTRPARRSLGGGGKKQNGGGKRVHMLLKENDGWEGSRLM